jgi:hypothetical protein
MTISLDENIVQLKYSDGTHQLLVVAIRLAKVRLLKYLGYM